jgi:hypothetical protein
MVPLAPRYDPLILELARALDDRRQPVAETVRLVGDAAEQLGLIRPSYSHLRRFIQAERLEADIAEARRAAVKAVVLDVLTRAALTGHIPNHYYLEDRIARAKRDATREALWLRATSGSRSVTVRPP